MARGGEVTRPETGRAGKDEWRDVDILWERITRTVRPSPSLCSRIGFALAHSDRSDQLWSEINAFPLATIREPQKVVQSNVESSDTAIATVSIPVAKIRGSQGKKRGCKVLLLSFGDRGHPLVISVSPRGQTHHRSRLVDFFGLEQTPWSCQVAINR